MYSLHTYTWCSVPVAPDARRTFPVPVDVLYHMLYLVRHARYQVWFIMRQGRGSEARGHFLPIGKKASSYRDACVQVTII